MKITHRQFLGAAASLLVVILSSGCSREAKAARKLAVAQECLAKNDYAAAEIEFKNLLEFSPGDPQALKGLGLIWVRQGASLDGARILSAAKSKLPKDDEVGLHFAQAMFDLGFLADSHKAVQEILDRNPNHGAALIMLVETSNTPEAMSGCVERIARAKTGDKVSAMLASALIQLRRGDIKAGTQTVDNVLQLAPDHVRALALKGKLLSVAKQPEKALEVLKKAASLSGPRSPENGACATLLIGLGRQDEAVALLKDATRVAPDYLPNWRQLGQISATGGKDSEATEYLSKVLAKSHLDMEAGMLQSQLWIKAKETAKAVELLENLTKAIPGRPMIEIALGKAYLAADDFRKAADRLDRVLVTYPGAGEALMLRAGLFLKDGQPVEAIRLMEPLYKAQPANRAIQDILLNAYRAANRMDDATAILMRRSAVSPQDAEPQFQLGEFLCAQGKIPEARTALERALSISPDHLGALSQLVALDQQEGKSDEAMARLNTYLSTHPDSAQAHLLKAGLLFARKEFKDAEAAAAKTIELKPDETLAYALLVRIQTADGRSEQAVERLKQLVKATPGNLEARMHLGTLQQQLGHIAEARACFLEMIKMAPEFAPAYNNLAYLESLKPETLDQALENARKARSLAPTDASICDTLGWIEWLRGDFRQALPLLLEAATKLTESAPVQYHLAMAYYMMHQVPDAIVCFEKALTINGEFPEKAQAASHLATLRDGGQWDLATLETRLKEDPKDIVLMTLIARKLAAAGRPEDALATYQSALAINPDLESAYVGQAELYASALNQPDKALEAATQARKVAPQGPHAAAILGVLNFRTGKFEQAYDLLREATRKLPEDPGVQYDAAWSAYSMGRIDDARSYMVKLSESDPSRAGAAREFLALTAPDAVADPASSALVEKILAKTPDHVPALMARGAMMEKAGENPLEIYGKVIALYPRFDPVRVALARIYLDDPKQLEKAEKLANEAREQLRNDQELGGILAIINFRKGQFDYAAQLLKELSGKRPLTGRELFALGISQAATKRPEEARKTLASALQTDLSESDAAKAKATLEELDKAQADAKK